MHDLQLIAKELDAFDVADSEGVNLFGFQELAHKFLNKALSSLFPLLGTGQHDTLKDLESLQELLSKLLDLQKLSPELSRDFFIYLPELKKHLIADANAILDGDPAAKSLDEVILCYPGFYAISVHRIAHKLELSGIPLLARYLAETAHQKTGIDIHPGARIGNQFCIDHGTGIVIGETTIIGNNVKLYHGVTLGGLSVLKSLASKKRHPTIEDNVVIYSNAVILGGNTVIGQNSIIGGNVWLPHSIDANSVVEQEEQQLSIKARKSS